MIGKLGLIAACVLIACPAATFAAEALVDGAKVARDIAPDGVEEIDALTLEAPMTYELAAGQAKLTLLVTPDGVVTFVQTGGNVDVTVKGAEGSTVTFLLRPGQRVSLWPAGTILVRGVLGEFTVEAAASGWAFVVSAEDVGRDGLAARCDNVPCRIVTGERLDTDRKGAKVVFRKAGRSFPGPIVGVSEADDRTTIAFAPEDGDVDRATRAAAPGVIADVARDFPWQSVPLPVLSWEVFRPADVSP